MEINNLQKMLVGNQRVMHLLLSINTTPFVATPQFTEIHEFWSNLVKFGQNSL